MTSRRPPSDGDSSRRSGIPRACRELGTRLEDVRKARQLSVEDVAARLILSRAQVIGLESADPAAFYTSAYFMRGLRKYMEFAQIPAEVLDLAQPEDAEGGEDDPDALRLTLAVPEPPALSMGWISTHGAWHGRVPITAAALLVTLAVAVGLARFGPLTTALSRTTDPDTIRLAGVAPIPAEPLAVASQVSLPVHAIPTSASAAEPAPGATVRLSVGKATWVFVRYPDNRVTERRLSAGEAFEVGPLPVYLAIGTADLVELRVKDRPVALEPYIRNGQVRITRPELAALKDPAGRR